MARLGIRGFKSKLKKAAEQLDALRTAEGEPIPPNIRAELRRHMERLYLLKEQIAAIERARISALAETAPSVTNAMVH
jgi:transposase